ncbi:MAG: TonB-dependent copper receptor [bacterium]|nr:TonB-dependent copper receptor [bacterium]
MRIHSLAAAVFGLMASPSWSAEAESPQGEITVLPEVVVTSTAMHSPLVVETDLKVPRQPLPAHDGADYLKTIPGFNVIRKGGTDGDPVLRGMAGSRLNILVDGQNILGGCNYRMDAPTAYIFPEALDKLTVIKGPQTVLYGGGNSAGTILFEREFQPFTEPGYTVHGSVLAGSFGRHDEVLDGKFGNAQGYVQLTGTNSQSGDYKDGNGDPVHSAYHRYNAGAALGWTPDANTRLELSGGVSDGRAAYADRGMDGSKFLRENAALSLKKKNLSAVVEKLDAEFYLSSVDHIMDDQTLRAPGMMGYANLQRDTSGGRLSTALRMTASTLVTVGVDAQQNDHVSRSAPPSGIYTAFADDATFTQYGLFGELKHDLDERQRVIAGYRADFHDATDERVMIKGMMMSMPNPTAGHSRDDILNGGFARLEQQLENISLTAYAGLGHSERFPDYWEMIAKEGMTSLSAFDTIRAEKTTQLDTGLIYRKDDLNVALSAFYNRIDDFILADYSSPMKMSGAVRNVDATTYGGEFSADYALSTTWKLNSSVSYVRGSNDSDNTALAQMPPLEGRVSLAWDNRVWSFAALSRMVAAQNRYDLNMGNIVGKDLGATGGFSVFSLNAGWRPVHSILVSAGIDNLFDRAYAESVSRAGGNGMGGTIPGYLQTTRVNEPGRTLWLKVAADF